MISVTSPCPESTILALGLRDWPIWGCDISTFPWTYDQRETCLILDGQVTVTPDGGEPVRFGAGDLVVFPKGMTCTWEVTNLSASITNSARRFDGSIPNQALIGVGGHSDV